MEHMDLEVLYPVPEDYEPPLKHEYTQEEADAFEGTMKPTALFIDAEERAATRRLTYVLVHEPRARPLLAELCKRQSPQNRL
jgi:hypothetical protein